MSAKEKGTLTSGPFWMKGSTMQSGPTPLNWVSLIVLGLIWGASFMAVGIALNSVGPFTVAAIRLGLGAVVLLIVAYAMGRRLPKGRVWLYIIGMGVFTNALPFSLLGWAQQVVPSAFAGVSMAIVPLFVLPLAFLLVPGEKMPPRKIIGFGIGFIGVAILIGIQDINNALAAGDLLPKLACVASAVCYAIGAIITRLAPPTPQIAYSAGGLLVGATISITTALIFEGMPQNIDATAASALIYLAVFPTALATILLVKVIQSAGPSFLSLVNYQVPVWSILFGVLFLGEVLPNYFLLAFGLIIAGVLISQSGKKPAKRAA